MQQDLRSMNLEEMAALLAEAGQPAFRAKQLFGWIHQKQVSHIEQMHNLGKPLLSYLEQQPNRCSDGTAMAKLAETLNIGRTSLYRAVGQLEKQGKIKKEGKRLTLLTGKDFPGNQ